MSNCIFLLCWSLLQNYTAKLKLMLVISLQESLELNRSIKQGGIWLATNTFSFYTEKSCLNLYQHNPANVTTEAYGSGGTQWDFFRRLPITEQSCHERHKLHILKTYSMCNTTPRFVFRAETYSPWDNPVLQFNSLKNICKAHLGGFQLSVQ